MEWPFYVRTATARPRFLDHNKSCRHLGEQRRVARPGAGEQHANMDPCGGFSERGDRLPGLIPPIVVSGAEAGIGGEMATDSSPVIAESFGLTQLVTARDMVARSGGNTKAEWSCHISTR